MTITDARPTQPLSPDHPARHIPRDLAARVRPLLEEGASSIADEIREKFPEFNHPPDSAMGQYLHRGVAQALHQFWDLVENPDAPPPVLADLYRDVGGAEQRQGRSLDSFQSALRFGSRTAFRYLADNREVLGISTETLCHIADAIFQHMEELASASAEGYAAARAQQAEEQSRQRRRLLQLLLSEPPPTPVAVAQNARAANWQLPQTAAAVVVAECGTDELYTHALPPDVLVDLTWLDAHLVVPDPDGPGRRQALDTGLRGLVAAVGPTVSLDRLPMSLRLAQRALELGHQGVLDTAQPIRSAEHLSTLLVFTDRELLDHLQRQHLAPLTDLSEAQQDRLAETLLAWLRHAHNASQVAEHLYVHPQTVRYRLRQITELFGTALEDPTRRFELEIALHARQLDRRAGGTRGDITG